MGQGRVPGGGAGGRRSNKWGGARPAVAREWRKWAGAAIAARELGRREGGGAWAAISARVGWPEGIVAFSIE
jgi:hypothetical protein